MPAVRPALTTLAQVGVVIFMFTVGYEIDLGSLRGRGRAVPLIAVSALLVPLSLGIACVLVFRSRFAALIRERGLAGTTAALIGTGHRGRFSLPVTILVLMALVNTLATAPLLRVIRPVTAVPRATPASAAVSEV